MARLAEKIGMDQHMLAKRLRRGYTMEQAVSEPRGKRRAKMSMTYRGVERTLKEWSVVLNKPYSVIKARFQLGWTPKQIAETPIKFYSKKESYHD